MRLYGDKDAKLRSDIRMLGNSLGNIIKNHDTKAFEAVEQLRKYGQEWRREDDDGEKTFENMVDMVSNYDTKKINDDKQSFYTFFIFEQFC
jgi:phosphoenolpyruvate carboxylase